MSTDNFVWTDELRKEFNSHMENVHYGHNMLKLKNSLPPDYFYHIETFKASKQQSVFKDWEIVEVVFKKTGVKSKKLDDGMWQIDGTHFSYIPDVIVDDSVDIFAVKRLSDGEVFSVGDVVKWDLSILQGKNGDEVYKIDTFNIFHDRMFINNQNICIDYLIKERKCLFTTLDNLPIYEGDEYWFFYPNYEVCKSVGKKAFVPSNKTFSTEDAANEYILTKKCLLSLSEIGSVVGGDISRNKIEELRKIAKSKLKQ